MRGSQRRPVNYDVLQPLKAPDEWQDSFTLTIDDYGPLVSIDRRRHCDYSCYLGFPVNVVDWRTGFRAPYTAFTAEE